MNARVLLFAALPLLAACDGDPFAAAPAPEEAAFQFSYDAPVTAEGFVDAGGGVRLHYRVVGAGPDTAVVLHGGPGLGYGYLATDLAPLAHGRALVFYDQRGAGRSTLIYDPAQLTPDAHVADLEAVRRHFGLERMALVGHSWGAMLATFYASAHPERVERMVLLAPGPITRAFDQQLQATNAARTPPDAAAYQGQLIGLLLSGQDPDPVGTCEALLRSLFTVFQHDPASVGNSRGDFCDMPPAAAENLLFTLGVGQALLGPNYDLQPLLEPLSIPALVVHGAADGIPFESSAAYAAALDGARFEVVEDAGHFLWLEEPVRVFTLTNAFLRRSDVVN